MTTPESLTAAGGMTLRPWREGDAAAVRAAFTGEPLMGRQAAHPVTDLAQSRRWLGERAAEWAAGSAYSWAVTSADAALLGCVQVSAIDRRHQTGWVSYWTVPDSWGRGVASGATTALAEWALGGLGLFRLELGHRTDNPASCRVATRAGFSVEGVQRGKLRYADGRHDVELHARLATD